MGYDVALMATVTLPEDAVARWKKHVVSTSAYADWPEALASPDPQPLGKKTSPKVGALLDALRKRNEKAGAAIAVREAGGTIEIAAVLSDDPFTLLGAWLAAALRDASRFGGRGRVDFVGFLTCEVAFSFDVEPEKSAPREIDEAEVEKLEKTPQFAWLTRAMDGAREPLPAFKWPKKVAAAKKAPPAAPASGATSAFGAVLSGEIRFPKKGDCLKWARAKVAPADFADWPEVFQGAKAPATAPNELGFQLQDYAEPPLAFFFVQAPAGRAWTKGALRADALSHWGARVAAAFRAAAAHGGEGKLRMLSPSEAPRRGFIVDVKPGAATVREAMAADWDEAAKDPIHAEATRQFASALA